MAKGFSDTDSMIDMTDAIKPIKPPNPNGKQGNQFYKNKDSNTDNVMIRFEYGKNNKDIRIFYRY